ncbi:MAG: hypothetical protein ACLFTA_01110 [Candidatus Nanohaloarchaea archaeon]
MGTLGLIALIIVAVLVLAAVGLGSLAPVGAITGAIGGVFGVLINWWQITLPIAVVAFIVWLYSGSRGGRSQMTEAEAGALGAIGGAAAETIANGDGGILSSLTGGSDEETGSQPSGTSDTSQPGQSQQQLSTGSFGGSGDRPNYGDTSRGGIETPSRGRGDSLQGRSNLNTDSQGRDMEMPNIFSGEDKATREEEQELHQLVKELEGEEELENQVEIMDEELKQQISQLLHTMDDFLQHEERLQNIMNGNPSVGEIMQHQEEIGQDIRAMNSDLAEIKSEFENVRAEFGEKSRVEDKVEELETAEERLLDDLMDKHRRIEKMQKNVNNLISQELDLGGYDKS